MSDDPVTVTNQSNPFSLGGGGVNFETRVQAAYTVLMLTGGVVPCLPAWPIQKIKLQGKDVGFNTDDFIAFVQNPETKEVAKLLAQIKHEVSITENDAVFSDVIVAAWHDFNTPSVFTEGIDAFALITGPLSAMDINHVRPILEWARHCGTAQEFITKINTPKLSSKTKQNKLAAFRFQLKAANGGTDVTDEVLWRFLKCFNLIGYDLDSVTGSLLPLLHSLIKKNIYDSDVDGLWSKIVLAVQSANQNVGTLSLATIPENVLANISPSTSKTVKRDILRLSEHGNLILEDIQSHIAGIHVDRKSLLLELLNESETFDFILITGARGNGKSEIVREFAMHLENRFPVFCFRTEDFNKPHLDNVFTSIGLQGTFSELSLYFSLIPKKYLLIESIEKLLELEYRNAFDDLLNFVRQSGDWTIIASGREYAFQQITFNFLSPKQMKWTSLSVPEFNDEDVDILLDRIPSIQPLGKTPEIRKLIKNPYMASLAVRAVEAGAQFTASDGEAAFRAAVWRNVIANESYRRDGLPTRRKQTFIEIAVMRAKAMKYGVPESGFDAVVLSKLEEDHLIRRDTTKGLVSPAHDILEDWALAEFIETRFKSHGHDLNAFVDIIGFLPAMNRAFRLWLHQKLRCESDSGDVVIFIINVIRSQIPYWSDEAITAVLLGDNPYGFLCSLRHQLFENDGEILKRFCFILRVSSKATDSSFIKKFAGDGELTSEIAEGLWLMPYGKGWEALVIFLLEHLDKMELNLLPHIIAVLDEWVSKINVNIDPPNPAREVGLLSLQLLEIIKDDHKREDKRKKLLGVIIKVVSTIIPEFQALLDRDVFNSTSKSRRETPGYVFQLLPMVLTSFESVYLCKYCPEILIKLAWHTWLKDDEILDRHHPGVSECFGLHDHSEAASFFPASGARGPFQHLLVCNSRMALDFILELCNRTAEKYAHSSLDSNDKESILPTHYTQGVSTVEIQLNDGGIVTQYCSHRLWCGYRGTSVLPYLLQSALMALENWLIVMAEAPGNEKTLEWIFDYVLRNSNSVMPTAVLCSIAIGFPDKLGKAALPMLRTPALYDWDLIRTTQEASALGAGYSPHDPFWKIYAEERKTGNKRPWRKESLEHLATRLQLTVTREEIFTIIDGFKENISSMCEDKGDDGWRYRLHRMDLRECKIETDQENSRILFVPTEIEPELKVKQQEFEKEQTIRERFIRMLLWAEKTFNRELAETNYFPDWREALNETKKLLEILQAEDVEEFVRMQSGGVVKACAVFVRDHHAELSEEDLEWCLPILVGSILAKASSDSHQVQLDKTGYDGSVAAAAALPILYDYVTDENRPEFLCLIATCLTHANGAVRCATAAGIREHLWQRSPALTQTLLNSALEYARLKQTENNQHYRNYHHDEPEAPTSVALSENWVDIFVNDVMSETNFANSEISWTTHSAWYLLPPLLMIPDESTTPEHVSLFKQLITMLSEVEESERNHRYSSDERIEVPDDFETEFARRFADYLLTISEDDAKTYVDLINQKINTAPDFIHWLLVCLLSAADKQKKLDRYWHFWNEISDSLQIIAIEISKNDYKVNRHDYRTKLLRGLFFSDTSWDLLKPEEYLFEHGLEHIYRFADSAGVNPIIFEGMCRFLFYLPNVFMPRGLSVLLKHQSSIGGTQLLSGVNTVYYLERILQRLLIRDQNQSSFSTQNRVEVLGLLSAMMETGSSTAYFFRERLLQMKM